MHELSQGENHVKEYGVTLSLARSCVWSSELRCMHFYHIWDLLMGDKCSSRLNINIHND